MIGKAIFDILKNDANIASRVASRIYPAKAPQNTPFPYITYFTVSDDSVAICAAGTTQTQTGRVQLDIWTKSQADADTIDAYAKAALNGKSGTFAGVDVVRIYAGLGRDVPELDDTATNYHKTRDYLFTIN